MKHPARKKASRSKEFEELAARLEAALAPKGARVKSPDRLRDQFTGQYREVDASIRYSIVSSDILITVECRDRVRTQDVTWIEQLATKRIHVRADRTLAISSSPFTQAAILAAKTHGISTRLISEITDEDIRSQMNTLEVTAQSTKISLRKLHLHYLEPVALDPGLSPAAVQAWEADGWGAQIFRVEGNSNQVSLDDIIKLAVKPPRGDAAIPQPHAASQPGHEQVRGSDLLLPHLANVPTDGSTVERGFALTFENEKVMVLTNVGWKRVQAIGITVVVSRSNQEVLPARLGSYATEDRQITNFAEHKIEWGLGDTWSLLSYPKSKSESH